jgi:hypothetical protein
MASGDAFGSLRPETVALRAAQPARRPSGSELLDRSGRRHLCGVVTVRAVLHLMVDASVWLNLAKRSDGQKIF